MYCTLSVHIMWHSSEIKRRRKDIAIGARGLGFDSCFGQIMRGVAHGSPPLRRFLGVVLPWGKTAKVGSATRYTLRRNTTSIMKI